MSYIPFNPLIPAAITVLVVGIIVGVTLAYPKIKEWQKRNRLPGDETTDAPPPAGDVKKKRK